MLNFSSILLCILSVPESVHSVLKTIMKSSGGSVDCRISGSALNEGELSFFGNTLITLALPLLLPVLTLALPSNILATVSTPLCQNRRAHGGTEARHKTESRGYQWDPNRRSRTHHRIMTARSAGAKRLAGATVAGDAAWRQDEEQRAVPDSGRRQSHS